MKGNLTVVGNMITSGNIFVNNSITSVDGGSIIINSGNLYINSPSLTTAPLAINGGVGITQNMNVGGVVTLTNTTANTGGGTTGALVVSSGGAYIAGTVTVGTALWVGTGGTLFQVVNSTAVSLSASNVFTALNTFNMPIFTSGTNTGIGGNVFGTSGNYPSGANNTAVGYTAGYNITTGYNNVFMGYQTGYGLTTGYNNTFISSNSGFNNNTASPNYITGYDNVFVGYSGGPSGGALTSGTYNTVVGDGAGINLTTSSNNVLIGNRSGNQLTTGYQNTIIGAQAGYNCTTGYNNTCFGHNTGYNCGAGYNNTFFGASVGLVSPGSDNIVLGTQYAGANLSSSATKNVFIGDKAGANCNNSSCVLIGVETGRDHSSTSAGSTFVGNYAGMNSTGNYNTLFGQYCGFNTSDGSGSNNTMIGCQVGFANAFTGNNNTLIGNQSGYNLSSGSSNVCIGTSSGYSLSTTSDNTFIGKEAGYNNTKNNNTFIGYQAGYNNNGNDNTFIGHQAGYNSTGSYNTFIGYQAGYNAGSYSYCTAIGFQANPTADHEIVIGNSNFTDDQVYIAGILPSLSGYSSYSLGLDCYGSLYCNLTITCAVKKTDSDYRIKDNIISLDSSHTVDNLKPSIYYNTKTKKEEFGLIAHELQEIYPCMVTGEKDAVDEKNEPLLQSINYDNIVALLVNEVQFLEKRIKILETLTTF
jgi:hypothetical protein